MIFEKCFKWNNILTVLTPATCCSSRSRVLSGCLVSLRWTSPDVHVMSDCRRVCSRSRRRCRCHCPLSPVCLSCVSSQCVVSAPRLPWTLFSRLRTTVIRACTTCYEFPSLNYQGRSLMHTAKTITFYRCYLLSFFFSSLTDWLTDFILHNKTLQINSEIENYNVQDRKEWTH